MQPKGFSPSQHRECKPNAELTANGRTGSVFVTARVSRGFEAVDQLHPPSSTENAVISMAGLEKLFNDWLSAIYGEFDQGT